MNMKNTLSGFRTDDVWGLGMGLLFGDDSGFSYQFQQLVKNAGVTHLVAASGANLAFVLTIPGLLLQKNSRWVWKIASFLSIGLYWQVSTRASSLWRAVVMWLVVEVAKLNGYQVSFSRVAGLLFASLLLFGRQYWSSPGYWLSWFAVCGMMFSQSILSGEKNIVFLPRWQKWKKRAISSLLIGFGVWLFVAPWIWWWWRQSSWLGIWTTWLLDPWLPVYQWGAGLLLVLPRSWWWRSLVYGWQQWLFNVLCQLMQWTTWMAASPVFAPLLKTLMLGLGWQWLVKVKKWWQLKKRAQQWRRRVSRTV